MRQNYRFRLPGSFRYILAATSAGGMLATTVWVCQANGSLAQAHVVRWVTLLALLQAVYFMVQVAQWLRHHDVVVDANDAALPTLAVVVPAYNEGAMVRRSMASVLAADYPLDKLQLVVVDDGSKDDTYAHIVAEAALSPKRVVTLRFAQNKGKRAALQAGFLLAQKAELLLTLDSDSVICPKTLRAMVAPFLRCERVGAVAGSVKVLNRDTWLGRMLDVRYFLAFDFTRAAQSTYGAVAVCPGALSAFRSAVVVPHLGEWCAQTFFGRPVRHGEDQALTNIVLKQGYDTVFQASAKVYTLVPTSYRALCKMYARWERSFIVEGLAFSKFMLTRYREDRRFWPAVHFAMEVMRLAMLAAFAAALPSLVALHLASLWRIAASVVLAGLWSALLVLTTERNYRFVFGVAYALFSFLFLQWIFPYALLTVRDERWGTR